MQRHSNQLLLVVIAACATLGAASDDDLCAPPVDPAAKDFCDSISGLQAGGAVIMLLLILVCMYPYMILGCAWCCCVKPKQQQGLKPTCGAWGAVIGMLFGLCYGVGLIGGTLTGILYLFWWFGPLCMIAPFCCAECFEADPARVGVAPMMMANGGQPVYAVQPGQQQQVQYVQPQVAGGQQQYAQQQPYAQQQQPQVVYATASAPPAQPGQYAKMG